MQKRRGLPSDGALPLTSIGEHDTNGRSISKQSSRKNKRAARDMRDFSRWKIVLPIASLLILIIFFIKYRILENVQESASPLSSEGGKALLRNESSNKVDVSAFEPSVKEPHLRPLRPLDREQYTIRIMTYRRNDQLLVSLNHHATCPGVALIQVIWCDRENFPPPEILNHKSSKVMVEFHSIDSLNERFHILTKEDAWTGWSIHPMNPTFSATDTNESTSIAVQENKQSYHFVETPTLGILSIDDDVLRPCEAIDAGFFRWTDHPDRIVGFDARIHTVQTLNNENHQEVWAYGYLSQVRKENKYSLTLPRYCFLHRDYLHMYMTLLPKTIIDFVAEKLNCEDIAMSFFVSSVTKGQLPLLADLWAMQSMIKLASPLKISDTNNHKAIRDLCVDSFAEILGLKGTDIPFQSETIIDSKTRNWFGVGVDRDEWTLEENFPSRRVQLYQKLQTWEKKKIIRKKIIELQMKISEEAIAKGILDQ